MASDQTMPPSEENMPSEGDPTMAPSGDMSMPQDGAGDGSVMISMPKVAFDTIHTLISQLAKGVDSLAQTVNQQAGQTSPQDSMPPAAPARGASKNMPSSDEDFMKSIAEAGSNR